MRVIADLHIHGRFSRATSKNLTVDSLARYATLKGLNVLGTGDFTHPKWLEELERDLRFDATTGMYSPKNGAAGVWFVPSAEVCTVFDSGGLKRVHHVILAPNFEAARQINDRLAKHGDLNADGRPTLNITAAELVEEAVSACPDLLIFPAHAWTP
jgi:PHP family Zn ribbon phosphoesterase